MAAQQAHIITPPSLCFTVNMRCLLRWQRTENRFKKYFYFNHSCWERSWILAVKSDGVPWKGRNLWTTETQREENNPDFYMKSYYFYSIKTITLLSVLRAPNSCIYNLSFWTRLLHPEPDLLDPTAAQRFYSPPFITFISEVVFTHNQEVEFTQCVTITV